MGKFFKGLASAGAWACFDEFNRIDVEVLSVVAQQIMQLQAGVQRGVPRIDFEGVDIPLSPLFSCFITMNPGYAGRTELPDNLKACFRPVAMMVPDYALIGEIMFIAYGFSAARELGQKMVVTFKLCSEQLSSQDHYDYGMRAVKTVITAAGNLKRIDPDMDENVLLLRALQDVNVPKFLAHDLPLFMGIMSDLFPGLKRPHIDYGALLRELQVVSEELKLQCVQPFLDKCIQLYETIIVRHGLMVVGPTGAGKSMIIKVLAKTLSNLRAQHITGPRYEKTLIYAVNPKSITMGQLYGENDPNTREWSDGILADIVREITMTLTPDLKWVVFDGPVDAIWIENMNTVLDDNKKLCLTSGEIITLTPETEMMFEVEDLAVASPATVSRCGMVYMEPKSLGLDVLWRSWQDGLSPAFQTSHKQKLQFLFDAYMPGALWFLRKQLKEPVPSADNMLIRSLINNLECAFAKYAVVAAPVTQKAAPAKGKAAAPAGPPPEDKEVTQAITDQLEPQFIFALIWSVGATTDNAGRTMFDAWLRAQMTFTRASLPLPAADKGICYDFFFHADKRAWVTWMSTVDVYVHDPKLAFSEMVIPTMDSVRYTYLINQLLMNDKNVLTTGPTGTGKSVNITQHLQGGMPEKYVPLSLTFSAQTSANMTQDIIDGKMEKRKKGVYGPAVGQKFILFVDDLNMPLREVWGAQPPIELLRQWCGYGGWYDRKTRTFMQIVDTVLLGAMGPPGGGRNPVTPRMIRQCHVIGYTEMGNSSMFIIYNTILSSFLGAFDEAVGAVSSKLTQATVDVYNTIIDQLRPTPNKPHYTFNMRDLGKIFQGMLMADSRRVPDPASFLRLWVHEQRRVFGDRLVSEKDLGWFNGTLESKVSAMGFAWADVVPSGGRLLFGDYMVRGADVRIYEEVRAGRGGAG
jgi:dynein heavy chain